jgi:hypothetical protein
MSYTPLASQSYNAELYEGLFASLFLNYPQFLQTTNFFDGVKNGQVIAIAGDTDDVTGGDACNTTETGTGNVAFDSVTLNPYAYLVNKPNCWADLKRDPLFLERFSTTKPRDLVANPEFADYVATFYKNGMVEDLLRYMYLGDTTAVIASSGGILRNGLAGNTVKYTRVDGFWKQIVDAGAAIQRVTISENALTTAATQFSGLTGAEILAYMLQGLSKMDLEVCVARGSEITTSPEKLAEFQHAPLSIAEEVRRLEADRQEYEDRLAFMASAITFQSQRLITDQSMIVMTQVKLIALLMSQWRVLLQWKPSPPVCWIINVHQISM